MCIRDSRYSVIMLNSIESSMGYVLKEFIDTQNGKKVEELGNGQREK